MFSFLALWACVAGYVLVGLQDRPWLFVPFLASQYLLVLVLKQRFKWSNLALIVVVMLFVVVFWGRYRAETRFDAVSYGTVQHVVIQISDQPSATKRSLKVRATLPEYDMQVQAYFRKEAKISYQDRCVVTGRLEPVDGRRNPGAFDYRRFLQRQGVLGQFFVSEIHSCQSLPSWTLKRLALLVRNHVHRVVREQLEKPYSELFLGLIFGQYGVELPESFTTRFRVAGLTHLLVVSGSQISLISGVLLAFFRVLRAPALVTFLVMVFIHSVFYLITGGGASIFRAIVMFDVMLVLSLMKRRPWSVHVGIVTIVVMMVINPLMIEDLGAQLSFLATFSLISIAPIIRDRLPVNWPESIREMIGVSLAPFCLTTPLIWVSFHMLSPYSVVANCVLMILVEWLVVLGFFTTLVAVLIPSVAFSYFNLCYAAMLIIDFVAVWVEKLPFSQFFIPSPPIWVVIWVYLGFLGWCFNHHVEKWGYRALFGRLLSFQAIVIVLLVCLFGWRFWPQPLQLWFLDVGQGDSILIRTPKRRHILIDAGVKKRDFLTQDVRYDAGKRVVLPVLRYFGIHHLDLLVISHMDMDHVGGMESVFNGVTIGRLLDNGNLPKDRELALLIQSFSDRRITAEEGMQIPIEDDLNITILHPGKSRSGLSENDQSLVMILSYKNNRFLFTGDLESQEERRLVQRYGDFLDVDVLKVGHHGSSTSSTEALLEFTSPSLGVIQVGRRNRYRHPNIGVLKRLDRFGVTTYRNDRDGAVLVTSDGQKISVTPLVR